MAKMLVASLVVAVVGLAGLGACGDDAQSRPPDAAGPDGPPPPPPDAAGPDAFPPDAGVLDPADCPAAYGPASIIDTFALSNTTMNAFDLDGDGDNDNILSSVAGLANGGIMDDLDSGAFRLISELRLLDDATLMNDVMVQVVPYTAVDTDAPVAPGDDFSHMEPFYFSRDSVNPADCSPTGVIPASIAGGAVSASGDVLPVTISGFGLVEIGEPRLTGTLATDAVGFQLTGGRLGGVIPACTLSRVTDTPLGMNQLHALVQFLGLSPDIDLDGDGIETIQTDSAGIISCTDGDSTIVSGETCACDPRIADGFSALFDFTSVGATLVGPDPAP
jgi:hypothetical protein